MVLIVFLIDSSISGIDFSDSNRVLCAKVGFLFHGPEQSVVVAGRGETANAAIYSDPSMKKTGRMLSCLHPNPILCCLSPPVTPSSLYLFNHTEPYGCTVCCINYTPGRGHTSGTRVTQAVAMLGEKSSSQQTLDSWRCRR